MGPDTMEQLRAMFAERDFFLLGLAAAFALIGLVASSKLAQYERIIKRHAEQQWPKWVAEDHKLQMAEAMRKMNVCPTCNGWLSGGRCKKCDKPE